ncbi:MAG: Ig-like domain-containing protein [Candidatus Hodarchaeota archaeon]
MKKSTIRAIAIIAIVLGGVGLTLGYFVMTKPASIDPILLIMGIPAPGAEQGQPGDPVVGILDPDHEETYSGNITIRAMVWAASAYSISVFRNGTKLGTSLPYEFNSTLITDGWYNITVVATDASSNVGWDTVWILVNNTEEIGQAPVVGIIDPDYGLLYSGNVTIRAMIWTASAYSISVIRNGSEIGTALPYEWDTTSFADGWYNITVVATDAYSQVRWDTVWILVNNTPQPGEIIQTVILETFDNYTYVSGATFDLNSTVHTLNITVQEGADLYVEFQAPGYIQNTIYRDDINVSLVIENNTWYHDLVNITYMMPGTDEYMMNFHLQGYTTLAAGEYKIYLRVRKTTGEVIRIGWTLNQFQTYYGILKAIEYSPGTLTFI